MTQIQRWIFFFFFFVTNSTLDFLKISYERILHVLKYKLNLKVYNRFDPIIILGVC
jgi:hypothetical protein